MYIQVLVKYKINNWVHITWLNYYYQFHLPYVKYSKFIDLWSIKDFINKLWLLNNGLCVYLKLPRHFGDVCIGL